MIAGSVGLYQAQKTKSKNQILAAQERPGIVWYILGWGSIQNIFWKK